MKAATFSQVVVRFQVEGFHAWPDAPEHRAYLAQSHRHMFHVEVGLAVQESEYDRGVEFHDLLDASRKAFPGGDMGAKSCEMMARELGEALAPLFDYRMAEIAIFEDGECGARIQLHWYEEGIL